LAHIWGEIVLTRSAAMAHDSNRRAALPNMPPSLSRPVAKAASTSKSWMCSQNFAPVCRATMRAAIIEISEGAMPITTSGLFRRASARSAGRARAVKVI
jgi:hypothetical protein